MIRPLRLRRPQPDTIRSIRHWAIELAVVVVGVLLALFLAQWAQDRREQRQQRETLERLDAVIRQTQAIGAVRVAISPCIMMRLAALDAALVSGEGPWRAMPLPNLPARMTQHTIYPLPYFADSIDVPVEMFDIADENGTLASLSPDRRAEYDLIRQDIRWIADNWRRGWERASGLAMLGVDGTLDERARYELRSMLVEASLENSVSVVRAQSLQRHRKAAGIELGEADTALFRNRIDFLRPIYGDCILEIDPETLRPRQ